MKVTFSEAVQQGLQKNLRILEQKRKIAALQRRKEEIAAENDWQWETAVEGRMVSDNTRTTAQKRFITLEGEREFKQGLKLKPELSVSEKELLARGLNKDSIDFNLELEQPLYPAAEIDEAENYKNLELRLKQEKADLEQLRRKLLIAWLADYLELIELKLEQQICHKECQLAQKILQQKRVNQEGGPDRREILEAKIDLNEAQQDLEEVKNDYQQSSRELKQSLGLESQQKLAVSLTTECDLDWLLDLDRELPDLSNSQQLLAQAKANSQELLRQELEEQQVKEAQLAQTQAQKPEVDLKANYDVDQHKWQVALNITHKLFNRKQDQLASQELEADLAALQEEEDQYLQQLKGDVDDLVGAITVNQLQVEEEELRLEKAVLDLEEVEAKQGADKSSTFAYQAEKLNLQQAELDLKEKQHQLLLSKYELIKLLGGLAV